MKKLLTTLACATALTTAASADLLRVEAGAGAWQQTPSGGLIASSSGATGSDVSNEDAKTGGYAWILFKHFVPIVPNIRLEYTSVESDGVATGTFADFTATTSPTNIKMKQYDIIPYYNILDNTFWITLDLGVDLKVLDMTYTAQNVTMPGGSTTYTDSTTAPIPMLYARTRVQLPFTGLGFEVDGKYVSYSDTTIYDARAKLDYTLDITPIIQPGIEVGYRVQKFKSNDLNNVNLDLDFKGVYAGIMLRF